MAQNKGQNFERDVCRTLSLWWSAGEEDDIFWRNRTRRTGKAYNAQIQEGDIIAVKSAGIPLTDVFCVECKSGYSSKKSVTKKTKEKRARVKEKVKNIPWDLLGVLDGSTGVIANATIVKFWEQARKAADLTNKIPLLIFKRDFHVPVVVVGSDFFKVCECFEQDIMKITVSWISEEDLYFYRLESFLKVFPPEAVKKYMRVMNV